jgi:aspartate kinase
MIRVFKFGGASVRDVAALDNAFRILDEQVASGPILLVVSAMGKMTNAFEILHKNWFSRKSTAEAFETIHAFHFDILNQLFDKNHRVFDDVGALFGEIARFTGQPAAGHTDFDRSYDLIVPYGELLSSCILNHYTASKGLNSKLINACDYVKGDALWREARIQWDITIDHIRRGIFPILQQSPDMVLITQGFVAGSSDGQMITLGREGSDFSASVFAYALDAESVTIWKDVAGLFNADPKVFENALFIPHLSYHEAVELAYYGQSIIHPKTIKPLQNKNIPLYIKSFIQPSLPGTIIDGDASDDTHIPCFILKKEQMLISVSSRDFAFINEHNLREIISSLAEIRIRMNVMQNSAISFSFCADFNQYKLNRLKELLGNLYHIRYNTGLELITVRNYNEQIIQKLTNNRKIFLEQRSRSTIQFVAGNYVRD